MALTEFQLKERANDWWVAKKASLREGVNWAGFKVLFYEKYFPESTKDKMLGQLLALQQGNKTVAEYEAEFNRLVMKYLRSKSVITHAHKQIKK